MKEAPQRNSPCPCGSGKKYKKCCGQPGLAKHAFTQVSTGSSLFDTVQKASSLSSAPRSLKDRIGPLHAPNAPSEKEKEQS